MDIPIILAAHGQDQIWHETQQVALNNYSDVEYLQKFRLPKDYIEILSTLYTMICHQSH